MNHSQYNKKGDKATVKDYSKTIVLKPLNKKLMVQHWINKTQIETKVEDNKYVNEMIESWKLINLQNNVNNLKLPKLETVNSMTLEQNVAYEAMLVNIWDIKPSDLNTSVEILLHLKIITNNQMYKFKIFE